MAWWFLWAFQHISTSVWTMLSEKWFDFGWSLPTQDIQGFYETDDVFNLILKYNSTCCNFKKNSSHKVFPLWKFRIIPLLQVLLHELSQTRTNVLKLKLQLSRLIFDVSTELGPSVNSYSTDLVHTHISIIPTHRRLYCLFFFKDAIVSKHFNFFFISYNLYHKICWRSSFASDICRTLVTASAKILLIPVVHLKLSNVIILYVIALGCLASTSSMRRLMWQYERYHLSCKTHDHKGLSSTQRQKKLIFVVPFWDVGSGRKKKIMQRKLLTWIKTFLG